MATILYGLAGEGMGHATRSATVIKHLREQGHDVHIVASNRAATFMAGKFPHVTPISGLVLKYENNKQQTLKSIAANFKPDEGLETAKTVRRVILDIKPNLIISDYEPTVAHLAGMGWKRALGTHKIPLLSIDNMHVITNCKVAVPKELREDYLVVKFGNDAVVPPQNVNEFLITTFFYPPVRRPKTTLIPSLLRDQVIDAKTSNEGHILVYQTSQSNAQMFDILKSFGRERFVIYGFNTEKTDENLTFKKFDETGFIHDLASCKAALANGGFSLMSEAVYLHKPLLSVPVKRHFEQACNALQLQQNGYGKYATDLSEEALAAFLYRVPEYAEKLAGYHQDGNTLALQTIDDAVRRAIQ